MLNVKLCSQRHILTQVKHLRWSFLTSVKPYFKNVLSLIELPLGSIYYATHPFMKKLTTVKTGRKILLLTIEQYFFSKFEITRWNGVINKEGFLN